MAPSFASLADSLRGLAVSTDLADMQAVALLLSHATAESDTSPFDNAAGGGGGPDHSLEVTSDPDRIGLAVGDLHPGTVHAHGQLFESHQLPFSIGRAGKYALHVSLRQTGRELNGSSLQVYILPGRAAARTTRLVPSPHTTGPSQPVPFPPCCVAGAPAALMPLEIVAHDSCGNRCLLGGAALHAYSADAAFVSCGVVDRGDGSYGLTWEAAAQQPAGLYTLHVSIDGVEMRFSPMPFAVAAAPSPIMGPFPATPPSLAPPSAAPPPSLSPPSAAPPSLGPPSAAPPSLAPPPAAPPSLGPPSAAPPSLAPPSAAPPSLGPPSATPATASSPSRAPSLSPNLSPSPTPSPSPSPSPTPPALPPPVPTAAHPPGLSVTRSVATGAVAAGAVATEIVATGAVATGMEPRRPAASPPTAWGGGERPSESTQPLGTLEPWQARSENDRATSRTAAARGVEPQVTGRFAAPFSDARRGAAI